MSHAMQELMEQKIWVCWKFVEKEGRMTKIPVAASGCATGTNEKYKSTWCTYEDAVAAAQNYSGVGFVVPKGYFFLDIDHKELSDPLVKKLFARFDSYAEKSVSGNGIHIYGKCDLNRLPLTRDGNGKFHLDKRYYMKNPNNGLELYIGGITNRFAVFTGNVIQDSVLKECTSAVLTTLQKDMLRRPTINYSEERDGDRESFDIVCNLRKAKNGGKFKKLFDEGDISDYRSQSEADAALCALIAFRVGKDYDAIDRLFRSSALYREKWDREDYRNATITAGIESCHGVFHRSVMPCPPFVYFNSKGQAKISCPLLADYVRKNLRYVLVRDDARHDILVYVYEDGFYKLYAKEMLMGVIKGYIAAYDDKIIHMGDVHEVYQHLMTDLNYISQDKLNADENIINFQNGLLRLSDLTLLPHSPKVFSTIQIPCKWTGEPSPTPVYDKYIHTLTDGDAEVENLCNEIIGVCISNVKGWRMKKSPFFYGAGDTGKSQLKVLVERILGKGNFASIDLKEMESRFGTGAIYGVRLAGSSDMSFLSVDELKTFKKVTGGDSLFAEFKGKQAFEFTYNGVLWFCMNRLPKFGGDDGQWVYDRIMPIECKNVIPREHQDKMLTDKMYAEREGIIFKAILALKNVISNGYFFSEPDSVKKARVNYVHMNNTVISFFEECMVERTNGKISDGATTGKIYNVYKAWCVDNNNGYAKTANEFRETLSNHLGINLKELIVHNRNGNFYKNLTLTDDAKEEYRRIYGYDAGDDFR